MFDREESARQMWAGVRKDLFDVAKHIAIAVLTTLPVLAFWPWFIWVTLASSLFLFGSLVYKIAATIRLHILRVKLQEEEMRRDLGEALE